MNEILKKRRLEKFGELPVENMSSTTRKFFKKWNHKKLEIRTWEKANRKKKA